MKSEQSRLEVLDVVIYFLKHENVKHLILFKLCHVVITTIKNNIFSSRETTITDIATFSIEGGGFNLVFISCDSPPNMQNI